MRTDVLALQRFYASPLGQATRAMVERRLSALWPQARGLDLLGYGYTTPYLEPYRADARRVVSFMPAAQGVERWPDAAASLSVIADEARLPFLDSVFDRALVVHALEEADAARPLLRELWRVLAPEARVILMVANRSGLWARADATPFGHGRPYSREQLGGLLQDALFQPTAWARALYCPPLSWRVAAGAADAWERAGETAWPAFGGVLLVEAVKRLEGGLADKAGRRVLLAGAALARP
jgi:SAM-dependent methyltransferase